MSVLDEILERPSSSWTDVDLDVIARVCNLDRPRYPFKQFCKDQAQFSTVTGWRKAASGELEVSKDGARTYVYRHAGARYFGLQMQKSRAAALAA